MVYRRFGHWVWAFALAAWCRGCLCVFLAVYSLVFSVLLFSSFGGGLCSLWYYAGELGFSSDMSSSVLSVTVAWSPDPGSIVVPFPLFPPWTDTVRKAFSSGRGVAR